MRGSSDVVRIRYNRPVISVAKRTLSPRAWTSLLAAVLVPALASASIVRGPETRVWGFDFENAALVGFEGSQALESRRAYGFWYGGSASDSTVAPSSGSVIPAARIRAIREALTDAAGNRLVDDELAGVKAAIRGIERKTSFRLTGAVKYSGNQGIDLTFEGYGSASGRFGLGEAKMSYGLNSLKVDALGIRQGSFDFFATRLQRACRLDLLSELNSGNVDLFGHFARSDRLFQFDPSLFPRNVNFRTTPGAARLLP